MPDNTPETQALLPVTPADREAAADIARKLAIRQNLSLDILEGKCDDFVLVQAFARHRQSHSLPGDVETAWERLKARCCADPDKAKRCVIVSKEDFFAALTPSALSGDAGEGDGWLPIETAPKDGTRILVVFDERKGNRVDAAHWRRNLRGDGGYFSSHIVEAVNGKKHMRENQPVRWQPMPVFSAPSHQGAE